jgi:hypothetical protein
MIIVSCQLDGFTLLLGMSYLDIAHQIFASPTGSIISIVILVYSQRMSYTSNYDCVFNVWITRLILNFNSSPLCFIVGFILRSGCCFCQKFFFKAVIRLAVHLFSLFGIPWHVMDIEKVPIIRKEIVTHYSTINSNIPDFNGMMFLHLTVIWWRLFIRRSYLTKNTERFT